MTRRLLAPLASLASYALTASAAGQSRPPERGMALSGILRALETDGVAWFSKVEWSVGGYWEVTRVDVAGRRSEIRVDPVTGAPLG